MQLHDVIAAWNAQADEYNQWSDLDADERVIFALKHMELRARHALDDLSMAAYAQETKDQQ